MSHVRVNKKYWTTTLTGFPANWGKKQALSRAHTVVPYTINQAAFGIYKPTV